MATSFLLAPIPRWVIMNNFGQAAGGAKLYTKRSLNPNQDKPVFQDPAGTIPWTNPIVFDENGTEGPFYWEVDSDDLEDTYRLEAYDSNDNLLWTITNYFPPGEGGGGSSTTNVPLNNLISNNVFYNNCGDLSSTSVNIVLAPSNHVGLTEVTTGTWGATGPDIRFVKNNTAATDTISFVPMTAPNTLSPDANAAYYVAYECNNTPAGETYKSFQFPICQGVHQLSQQTLTFSCWARSAAGSFDINIYERIYYGSGASASAEERNPIQTSVTLTTTWTQLNYSYVVANTSGKTLSNCGDDAYYIQLDMPLDISCEIFFTKPSLYLGTINPLISFETFDEVNAVSQSPRTGDVRTSMNNFQPFGWVIANDGTIGGSSSNATTRANVDTFPLYSLIWNSLHSASATGYAPIFTSAGAASSYGSSAVDDYLANKQLSLTKALGSVLAGTVPASTVNSAQTFTVNSGTDLLTVATSAVRYGTATPVKLTTTGTLPAPLLTNQTYYTIFVSATTLKLAYTVDLAIAGTAIDITDAGTGTHSIQEYARVTGFPTGEDKHTMTQTEVASHTHHYTRPFNSVSAQGSASFVYGLGYQSVQTDSGSGDATPFNIMQTTTFYNMYFKL